MIIPEGILKRIFVKSINIKKNNKSRVKLGVIGIWTSEKEYDGFSVDIRGPSQLVYSSNQMVAHAHVWIETTSEVYLETEYEKGLKKLNS